jgi:hypothetical protein
MSRGRTRRSILYGAGFVVAGAAVPSPARAAGTPSWRIGTVTTVRDGAVQVDGSTDWLPLEGFPDGWEALVDDRVAVAPSATGEGESANPLMHWTSGVAPPADLRPGQRVNGGSGPRVVEATLLDPELAGQRRRGVRTPASLRLAVGDRASPDGVERVLAIRRV